MRIPTRWLHRGRTPPPEVGKHYRVLEHPEPPVLASVDGDRLHFEHKTPQMTRVIVVATRNYRGVCRRLTDDEEMELML